MGQRSRVGCALDTGTETMTINRADSHNHTTDGEDYKTRRLGILPQGNRLRGCERSAMLGRRVFSSSRLGSRADTVDGKPRGKRERFDDENDSNVQNGRRAAICSRCCAGRSYLHLDEPRRGNSNPLASCLRRHEHGAFPGETGRCPTLTTQSCPPGRYVADDRMTRDQRVNRSRSIRAGERGR